VQGALLEITMRIFLAILISIIGGNALAQNSYEPKRGTATRAALMDAIRPHVEQVFGKPIQFVVQRLQVSGDVAFASLHPQRRGGVQINLRRLGLEEGFDGVQVIVFYKKQGKHWVVVRHDIGETEVWWEGSELCLEYRAVAPLCD
tara:strand:+ start:304 stop:741 length:438 start_codon:yes stop_codon:yes gene_type:complete